MRIYGLVSSYREGRLVKGAVESLLKACDTVFVIDGPVLGTEATGDESEFPRHPKVFVRRPTKPFVDDAAKRSALVTWARERGAGGSGQVGHDPDRWYVVLDGDEILLWPEYLQDWIARNAHESDRPLSVGLRLVELDGSVAMVSSRVLYAPAISSYVLSSHVLELVDGSTVTLPNEPLCGAGGLPMPPRQVLASRSKILSPDTGGPIAGDAALSAVEIAQHLTRFRSPLQGEAHILHRSALRPPTRTIERQHVAEGRAMKLREGLT